MLGSDKSYIREDGFNLDIRDDTNAKLGLRWNFKDLDEVKLALAEDDSSRVIFLVTSDPHGASNIGLNIEAARALRTKLDEMIKAARGLS
ncbi:hypothetical protein [Paenibacillus sp. FSL H7-0331]|uniref:hypothetical protein n=1 Tax=Paenibacillus sp. FSL H7-0331 TaxID=1920421 RepID=UPI00096FEB8F|nr:hypothetical protein [Paenibacillus sp. FSL H7-0331]OME97390.1 hypothetical protein BK127_40625 [Paenibacillus sp. FSL H7-0331]